MCGRRKRESYNFDLKDDDKSQPKSQSSQNKGGRPKRESYDFDFVLDDKLLNLPKEVWTPEEDRYIVKQHTYKKYKGKNCYVAMDDVWQEIHSGMKTKRSM